MVNNFSELSKYLTEQHGSRLDQDCYYFCQIIKRGKDLGETDRATRIVKDYFISSPEKLLEKQDEIVGLCEYFGARAYLNPNVKSFKRTYSFIQKRMADIFDNQDYKSLISMLPSAAGNVSTRDNSFDKVWIVDYDNDDTYDLAAIKMYLYENKINYFILPTKNGLHFLTKPFRLDLCPFSGKIQKHNPTLLYYGG